MLGMSKLEYLKELLNKATEERKAAIRAFEVAFDNYQDEKASVFVNRYTSCLPVFTVKVKPID